MKLIKGVALLVSALSAITFVACGGGGGGDSSPPAPTGYAVSGTILAAAGNVVDSDVNDTGTMPVSNNNAASAQPLGVPSVVGGYVNVAGAGSPGNSFAYGDAIDIYRASLIAGDTIRLTLPDNTDLNATEIYLTLRPVGQSAGSTSPSARSVVQSVDFSGDYYIEVEALSGATSYRLIVGSTSDLPLSSLAKGSDFVPGEVLVQLRSDDSQTGARSADMLDFSRRTGLKHIQSTSRGWMRLRADDRSTVFQRLNLSRRTAAGRAASKAEQIRIDKEETLRIVEALGRQPDVAHAQPNFIRHRSYTPNDPLYPLQWHLNMIHLPQAWDRTTGSAGVIVAVIDTGILPNHPDLIGKIAGGYDFISDPVSAGDGDGPDPDYSDPGDSASGGSSFHGTHTAGTIAAAFDNALGVAGVGGNTRIMPVRVLGRSDGTDVDIANAIYWAAGAPVTITTNGGAVTIAGASPPADIINLSLGGPGYSDILHAAVAYAYNAGVIMVAAAGNDANNVPNYPAAFGEVISVSAVDANAKPAWYSNYGPTIEVAAPGGDLGVDLQPDGYADGVLSTVGNDVNGLTYEYTYYHGTSMATAHMSGVAALMKAVRPGLTPDELIGYLSSGMITSDLGAASDDDLYGYGLIDAYQAVLAAESYDPPTVLSVSPGALRFDPTTATAKIFLRQVGIGGLALNALTVGYGWLSVVQTPGQDPGLGIWGQYTVTVNRAGLTGGVYTDYIEFVSSSNTVRIPVTMEVLPDPYASASTQYLMLMDADTQDTVIQQTLLPSNGRYAFTLTNVPPGSYYLLSGSDLDNDYSVMNEGEAAGGYRTLDDWVPFTVSGNVGGLNFVTGFSQWPFFLPEGISALSRHRP